MTRYLRLHWVGMWSLVSRGRGAAGLRTVGSRLWLPLTVTMTKSGHDARGSKNQYMVAPAWRWKKLVVRVLSDSQGMDRDLQMKGLKLVWTGHACSGWVRMIPTPQQVSRKDTLVCPHLSPIVPSLSLFFLPRPHTPDALCLTPL